MAVHKSIIIADPEGYGWEYASKIYEELKIRLCDFELSPVNIKKFKDGEIKPKIEKNIRKRNCYFIHDPNLYPADWFLQLCLVNQALKKSAAQEIINVLPYLKFSRQDRKDESRVPISAKVIADVIELYADRLLTLDFHNPAIDGFYKIPLDNLSSYPVFVKYIKENHKEILNNLVIMSTDAGGAPRAKAFAKKLRITDFAVGYKSREKANEIESFKILGEIDNKNVLIIDDIVDTGGTLIKACEAVRKQGALKIYGYCTHGLFTEGIKKVTDNFDLFFIGDTIKLKEPPGENVKIISFAPLFAEAISRMCEGESLSELFD
ncbi:MAG: ribose-phosphate diphosphokinase [Nanoarchaeota archaeon]|nr:ribose-phosphate diphosphokinase [Nanoarchaeota archaeon]